MKNKIFLALALAGLAMLSVSCTKTTAVPHDPSLPDNQASIPVDFDGAIFLKAEGVRMVVMWTEDMGDSIGTNPYGEPNVPVKSEDSQYILQIRIGITNLSSKQYLRQLRRVSKHINMMNTPK